MGSHQASWVEQVTSAAHSVEESLSDRQSLDELARTLADIADSFGAEMVTGASSLGHQLAGVVASHSTRPLTLWANNGAHGTVLVIESVLASGVQLMSAARRAQAAGASRVVGAAVFGEPMGIERCRAELADDVVVVRPLELTY